MKLMRLGDKGSEKPALWLSDREALDVSSVVEDLDPAFFAGPGTAGLAARVAATPDLPRIDLGAVRVGAPVGRPGKFMAIGLNYSDHARDTGAAIPEQPIVFAKATSCINGPYDDVVLPSNYATVDHEVELAVVVGHRGRRIARSQALSFVAGYLICNDVSERTAQRESKQWFRAK